MQTTLEHTDQHVVRITVEVPADEYRRDVDLVYRRIASEVKIPGFRKGKVPRAIIDARVGRDAVFHEFVEQALPAYYTRALREHDLAPIADPDIDIGAHELADEEPFRFTATVEVRPRLSLTPEQYRGIEVQAPPSEPTDEEIDRYIDQLRERFAELEGVPRPARRGDYVLADVRASVHDREVPEATRVGFLSEVGSEELVAELDKELEGKRKGDILKFNATLPERFGSDVAGQEVTFNVLVKDVKTKRLPDADDDFAKTASEYDTLAELREDIRGKLAVLKDAEAKAVVRDEVLARLVELADVELPERLVDDETEQRVQRAHERAERVGTTLEQALAAEGWDELRFRSDARAHAVRGLKADLVLEAIARAEGIQATGDELDREITELAQATGRDPREVRRLLERSGQIVSLAADVVRSKALDVAVEAASVSRSDGEPAKA